MKIPVAVLEGDRTGQELLEAALGVLDPVVLGLELDLVRFARGRLRESARRTSAARVR